MLTTSPSAHERTALLVHHQPLWLETLSEVVARVGIRRVHKATSAAAGEALLTRVLPDLLVTDLRFPGEGLAGIELLRRATAVVPGIRSLVLCAHDGDDHVDAAFEAGASACVHRRSHPEDVACAVRQLFDRSVHFASDRRGRDPETERLVRACGLTARELEVLRLVAEGRSNAEVARALWVTEQTVKFHLSNTYRKIDVGNRTEASRWAQRHGMLDGADPGASPRAGEPAIAPPPG